jgi:hypothetical protein
MMNDNMSMVYSSVVDPNLFYLDSDPQIFFLIRILIKSNQSNQTIYFEQSRHTILLTFMEIDVNRHEYEHNSTNFLQFSCINNTLIF